MFFSEIYQPGVADFDRSGKLGYEAILRIFENTASRHSDSSGDDIIEESRNGITWVLTDWRVRIVRRPDSKAPLRVTTWVRDSVPTGRVFRDYTLADETGTELVCGVGPLQLLLATGVGHDRAAVHRQVAPRYQPGRGAPRDYLLE